ncbi:unnamed protein product [Meloidogyne enterolobii]|uniref:Uncharacterized protein n=1 Tax=Meloidogyne enterolobii TaxID=390850 RepID=A0ACB1A241_MELEN
MISTLFFKATRLAALNLREHKWDKFKEISTKNLTNYLINRLPQIKEEDLFENLNFTQNQIVCGFIYSSFFSCDSIVRAFLSSKREDLTYNSMFVFFIDKTIEKQQNLEDLKFKEDEEENINLWRPTTRSISKLLKKPENLLICNISLARHLGGQTPANFGRWKITELNFFDCKYAINEQHCY